MNQHNQTSEPSLANFYQDAILRRAADFAPNPSDNGQIYRLALHLATSWRLTDDGLIHQRWEEYTPAEKQEWRDYARELALEAKQQREAAYAVSA
jgi:hypothetical protein